jgi:polysaccharide biosynthesis transport protein
MMIRLSANHLNDPSEMASSADPYETALEEAMTRRNVGAQPRQNALRMIHRFLRGRYRWVLLLGIVLGGLGAFAGYHHGSKIYTCTGSIRVNYYVPRVLYTDPDEAGALPGFDAFVEAQAEAMVSRKVIEVAIREPMWTTLWPEPNDLSLINLTNKLQITQKNYDVEVSCSDRDPAIATAAVNSDIAAYRSLYIDEDPDAGDSRVAQLRQMEGSLSTVSAGIRKQILDIANQYGTENIEPIYAAKLDQFNKTESAIQDLELSIDVGTVQPQKPQLAGLSDQTLSFLDERLSGLFEKISDAKLRLSLLSQHFGPNNPDVQTAQATVDGFQKEIDDRVAELRTVTQSINIAGLPQTPTKRELDAMQVRLAALKPRSVELRKELVDLGTQNLQLSDLGAQADDIKGQLEDVRRRIQELEVEKPSARRIEVLSEGEAPLVPDKDTRPRLAAMGGFGGAFMAFFSVLAVSFLNARLSAPQDLHIRLGSRPILGVVPMLKDGPDFARRANLAAECVHTARTMLEIWGRGAKQLVIGVTSPSFESGNTSVTMSLGVSFAAAGLRTLLVDCDFVGGGLTNRLAAVSRRDLAAVLQRSGLVSEAQVHHAMRVAAADPAGGVKGANGGSARRSLGEICVELGYLSPPELDAALALQSSERLGILDALSGEQLQTCVSKTGIKNLSVLPLGSATAAHAAKLSSQALRHVLEAARQQYDTIILDTRSILGSLESSIVASAVDGMVVTIARGEQKSHCQDALNRLKSLVCPVAGIIFNKASLADIPSITANGNGGGYPTTGSVDDDGSGSVDEPAGRLATLGPLARATISYVPTSKDGTELG